MHKYSLFFHMNLSVPTTILNFDVGTCISLCRHKLAHWSIGSFNNLVYYNIIDYHIRMVQIRHN
jgi:hypothetical protein